MTTLYPMVLSTTEPNNPVGMIKVRKYDAGTQTFDVTITENGELKDFTGLTPFFCVKSSPKTGLGISEQIVTDSVDAKNGRLKYTLTDYDMQHPQTNHAYFAFKKLKDDETFELQFTTKDFRYTTIASIFDPGIHDSNYIWTFEEMLRLLREWGDGAKEDILQLISDFKDWINTNQADFDKWLQNNKDYWADWVESCREILEDIDPGGKILTELIDARDGYSSLKDRLTYDLDGYLVDMQIDIGGSTKSYFLPAIEELKNKIDKSRFNLLFETDLHYDQGRQNYPLSNLMLPHLNNALSFDGDVDVILFGGDNIDGYQPSKKTNLKHLEQFTTKALCSAEKSDVFLLNGNHDDGSIRTADFGGVMPANQVISQAEFKQHFMTEQLLNDETRDGDSIYFYKDYPDKKIRLIGLDSVDTPDILDADGNIKYQKQFWCGYQSRQLEWLAEVALQNVPVDYHTLIVTHVHLSMSDKDNDNGTFEYHPNHASLVKIIEAFKVGGKVALSSSLTDYEIDFEADFTSQGERIFVGVFNGHVHKNAITTIGTITNIWLDCSISKASAELGTPEEDSFNVISIDTINNKIDLLGFGRSVDRSITY